MITHRSDPPEIIDAIMETNRFLTKLLTDLEQQIRDRAAAEERYEGLYYKSLIGFIDGGSNVTTAKAQTLAKDNIRDLKKAFEIAKGIEDMLKKKIKAFETSIESLRSLLSFQKNKMERGV
jgi:hypothetical protein